MTASAALRKFGSGSIALPRIVLASNPLKIAAAVVFASLFITGIFFYGASAQTTPLRYVARAIGGGASSAAASSTFSTISPMPAPPIHEVHIANNGLVYMRGALVTSINNGILSVSLALGESTFNWTVKTDSNTKFIATTGEKGTFNTILVGNYIDVTGILKQGGTAPIIAAQFIRE